MSAVGNILSMIKNLSAAEKRELKMMLLENANATMSDMESFMTDESFAGGMVCPHCGCIHVVRNGHQEGNGKQRYLCRDCGKSFDITSNSIVSGTHKGLDVWERYIACMMQGLSIRKTAEICEMHRNTAFNWRHKILDALQDMSDKVELDGIVEADETFFPISYKGNHSNDESFTMPRKPHKRGGETHVRGLSKEQVCVACAVNRNGLSIGKVSNLGRISTKDIENVLGGRIDKDATLVTDKMNSYVKFADSEGIKLVQVKGGKSKRGIYNVQRVNSYHSSLSKFMRGFNGVATKYLNGYLAWHNFMKYSKHSDAERKQILLRRVLTLPKKVVCKEISNRDALAFAV